jgi:hypothetical protein
MFALDHSADLTPAHRFSEIVSILAAGFVRFRAGSTAPEANLDAVETHALAIRMPWVPGR